MRLQVILLIVFSLVVLVPNSRRLFAGFWYFRVWMRPQLKIEIGPHFPRFDMRPSHYPRVSPVSYHFYLDFPGGNLIEGIPPLPVRIDMSQLTPSI